MKCHTINKSAACSVFISSRISIRTLVKVSLLSLILMLGLLLPSKPYICFAEEAGNAEMFDEEAPLILTYEPKKLFIAPSIGEEGESILFNLELKNPAPFKITIKKFLIRFLAGEDILAENEQDDSFFRHGLIKRKKKLVADSMTKWSGICLTAESFTNVDTVQLVFHLKWRRKYRGIQTFNIPVSRYLQKTTLILPFKGLWKVTQGHACRSNHRLSGYAGDFAWDFAALGENWGATSPEYFYSKDNKDVYGFGKDVLAPAAGKIIKVVRDVMDNTIGEEYPRKSLAEEARNPLWAFGNFVVIDHKNGEYSLLAHLQKGSIAVRKGEKVEVGQRIGKVGNSGNTKVPHLHYQLMNGEWPIQYEVSGLPALFSHYYTFIQFPRDFSKGLDEEHWRVKMIKVTNGDPARNSIIYAPD